MSYGSSTTLRINHTVNRHDEWAMSNNIMHKQKLKYLIITKKCINKWMISTYKNIVAEPHCYIHAKYNN
jgi:hypothetical protein